MKRLRPTPTDEELKTLYPKPHQSQQWNDHNARIEATVSVGKFLLTHFNPWNPPIIDLSCGDGRIAKFLQPLHNSKIILGDFAPGYPIQGKIEDTVKDLPNVSDDYTPLFILSETLEHVDAPLELLLKIREKTDFLLLSTPIDEPEDSVNLEHLWTWGIDDLNYLLRSARFQPIVKNFLYLPTYYDFQIWGCL